MQEHKESATLFHNNESYRSWKSDNNLTILMSSDLSDCPSIDPPGTQHLTIDFTPDEQRDNDFVQNKCCDFWDFIHSIPEIQHLMVMPEIIETPVPSIPTEDIPETVVNVVEEDSGEVESKERNALSMLEFAKQKGLINRTFEVKMPRSQCTLGSREYKDFGNGTQSKMKTEQCYSCLQKPSGSTSSLVVCPCEDGKPTSLKTLVQSMQDWDAKHPKSMKPPSHPARLQHCIQQRNTITDLES
ncbi:unnamed protein product [Arctia plantaginis]|uniref:Uncharacterized protein n=1 Tax=Arctia plantaginis TaxID=874455 RepID=A0A8S1B543_ARCPL|nr:unnamed protein product [Arctia plantaginis]